MKKHNLTKSVSIIFMLLTMMFSCQTIEDDGGSTEDNTASYKVEHYQQNIENDEFTLVKDDTEEKSGKIGEDTKAQAKAYAGFTAKTVTQEKITADGKTVVKIEYTRNIVTLTFDTDGGSEVESVSGKYGATFTITAPTKSGYKLNSWEPELPTTFPAKDTKYTAKWTKATIAEEINALTEGTHTITMTGTISSSTISDIKTALESLSSKVYVNLDLSKTTGLTTIGEEALKDADQLTSIILPDSVTSIGDEAFYYCRNLTSVTIPDSVTSIGDKAFYYCSNLASIQIDENNQTYSSYSNCIYNKDGTTLYLCGENVAEVTILETTTTICDNAFYDCDKLTSVTIPDNVTTIGKYAFAYCNKLTSVAIGKGVTTIGESAFYYCDALTSVTIPDSVTTIGECAFYDCDALTSVTIPDSVTTIGYDAFNGCISLTSVTIGKGVTSIGKYAFFRCSKLTSVTFADTTSTWYYTSSSDYTGGTEIDVTDTATNATNLTETYSVYWYKK